MPRLRQVRTHEEAEKVPLEQEIQIVIPPEGEVVVEEAPLAADGGKKEPPKEPPKAQAAEYPDESPETAALKKRFEDLTKAEAASRDRETVAIRERDEARRQHEEAVKAQEQSREEADDARYVAVLNRLDAANAEAEAATRDFEAAASNGDYKAQSEANRRINKAEVDVSFCERAKAEIEEAKKTKAERKETPATRTGDPFENAIAALPEAAKAWLRSHPEYITDPNKNEDIRYFDMTARRQGIRAYTPEYFESIEVQAGLRVAQADDEEDEEIVTPPPKRSSAVPSAPPSREATSAATGKRLDSKITLSPEQRGLARQLGISEVEYAKQVIKMREAKANGRYNEG